MYTSLQRKKQEFQQTIQDDPLLHSFAEAIVAGWPEDVKDVPNALRPYHNHHDEMTVEDVLILKGEALVIPPTEREKILQAIHEGHQGITKCQYRARHCVYWPGINQEIQHMVKSMYNMSTTPPIGTTATTPTNTSTWTSMVTHWCSFNGFEYLVIVDYYSKMPFVRTSIHSAMLPKLYQCSRNCSLSMGYQRH